uniref:polynucleotide adenylyltransferase n=1 Tax=Meloidogyne javanica TaxID=6303 RepID=A0A915M9U8_MELJA
MIIKGKVGKQKVGDCSLLKLVLKLENEFNETIYNANWVVNDMEKLTELENRFHSLLKELTMIMDNWRDLQKETNQELKEEEIKAVKIKLHKQRLANLNSNRQWNLMKQKKQKRILFSLLNNTNVNEFNDYLHNYEIKNMQRMLISSTQNNLIDFPIFDELPYVYAQKEIARNILNEQLTEIIDYDKDRSSREIIKIVSIISKWAKSKNCHLIEFLLSGSRKLNSEIIDSDVDAIVVLHKKKNDNCKINGTNNFYGNPDFDLCQPFVKNIRCWDNSFYCYLCNVKINFDISFIIIDEIQSEKFKNTFPITELNNQEFEEIIEHKRQKLRKLYKAEDLSEIESEIYSLASYNSNNIMLEFIEMTGNVNKLQLFARTIKKWAKNHFIYDGQFGFLNGATVNVLVIKVLLLYFDSSLLYLLQKFFQTYMEWDWQNIVSLDELTNKPLSWSSMEELNKRKRIFLGKKFGEMNRLENHANLIMIVLTPGYPKQNCSFNVNYSTRQIIQKELEIESRIRLELVFSIEDDNLIKYAHAFSKENWLPNEIKQKYG